MCQQFYYFINIHTLVLIMYFKCDNLSQINQSIKKTCSQEKEFDYQHIKLEIFSKLALNIKQVGVPLYVDPRP